MFFIFVLVFCFLIITYKMILYKIYLITYLLFNKVSFFSNNSKSSLSVHFL